HYNVEIQRAIPGKPGRYERETNLHIVVNENFEPVDIFGDGVTLRGVSHEHDIQDRPKSR
ncbi:MAG TPA: hypothetical protein VJB02_03280, partial [Coxiellaceae bacterium]|nr:hypothetical protein [Coxiellaceae bacterium]